MDALAFSEQTKAAEPQPIYVLAGEERFLKRLALERIERLVLAENAHEISRSVYEGDAAELATVRDELETLPFLSARRLVVVQDADPFVTRYREALEKYAGRPSRTGVLVLDVKSWKSNTRLAKIIPESATIKAETPPAYRLPHWCVQWAASRYGRELAQAAANLLVDLIGPEMGVLDQELAKLASYVGDAPRIEAEHVDELVGHSRVQTAWQMLDALADGNRAEALATLNRLLDQGEEPIAILGAMSWQLRRLAQVARLQQQGSSLGAAMGRLSIPPFAQKRIEQHVRHLGPRAFEIYDWLLEADQALKSTTGFTPGMILERLLIKLAG